MVVSDDYILLGGTFLVNVSTTIETDLITGLSFCQHADGCGDDVRTDLTGSGVR